MKEKGAVGDGVDKIVEVGEMEKKGEGEENREKLLNADFHYRPFT